MTGGRLFRALLRLLPFDFRTDYGQELRRFGTEEKKVSAEIDFGTSRVQAWTPAFSMPYARLNQLYLRGYVPELEHFARRVRQGAPPLCGIDDMEQTLLVRQAVERSDLGAPAVG